MNAVKLVRDPRLPLYQRLREEFLEKIGQREWLPDVAIPSEGELAQLYGVAIGTVRKTVETLENDGILERKQGSGTFVRRPNFGNSLFRFFRHVDHDGERRIPQGRVLSCALAQAPSEVAKLFKLKADGQAIRLERQRFIDGKIILSEEIWLPKALFANLLKRDLADFADLLYPFYELHCGQTIAFAQETLTVEEATADLAKTLGIAKKQAVVVIERLALGYDRQALEWRRSYGAAQRFRYQVEIG